MTEAEASQPAHTRLVLIRHGQSQWNLEGRIQGQTDVPLSELGERQAEAVSKRLASEKIGALYASPLRRALHTAEVIDRHHGLGVRIEPVLTEIDHGLWQGRTEAEIEATDGERLRQWQLVPGRVQMPDGERLYDVRRRALGAIRAIAASHQGRTIVIVSHELVIKIILAEVLGMDYDHLGRLVVANTSLSIVESEGDPRLGQVLVLNDTAHLHGVS